MDTSTPEQKWATLSDREKEIANLASMGLNDREASELLGISLNTVRTYWNRIRMKLKLHKRSDILAFANLRYNPRDETERLSRYQTLTKYAGLALLSFENGEWVYEMAGPGYAALHGTTPPALVGRSYRSMFTDTQWEIVGEQIRLAEKNGMSLYSAAPPAPGAPSPGAVLVTTEFVNSRKKLRIVRFIGVQPVQPPPQ